MSWRLTVLLVAISSAGLAEPTSKQARSSGAPAPDASGVTVDADGTRRDPEGIKGINAFWQALQAGDRAAVARQYTEALVQYQAAIQASPRDPLGHYRAGQASVAAGDFPSAEATYQASLRYAAAPEMKARVLFVLADLRERQGQIRNAIEAWQEYQGYVTSQGSLAPLAAVAVERIARLETWQKLTQDYAEVKARIAARATVTPQP